VWWSTTWIQSSVRMKLTIAVMRAMFCQIAYHFQGLNGVSIVKWIKRKSSLSWSVCYLAGKSLRNSVKESIKTNKTFVCGYWELEYWWSVFCMAQMETFSKDSWIDIRENSVVRRWFHTRISQNWWNCVDLFCSVGDDLPVIVAVSQNYRFHKRWFIELEFETMTGLPGLIRYFIRTNQLK
jgi:hypothetical protein